MASPNTCVCGSVFYSESGLFVHQKACEQVAVVDKIAIEQAKANGGALPLGWESPVTQVQRHIIEFHTPKRPAIAVDIQGNFHRGLMIGVLIGFFACLAFIGVSRYVWLR